MSNEEAWFKVGQNIWFFIGAISPTLCGFIFGLLVQESRETHEISGGGALAGTLLMFWAFVWQCYWVFGNGT